MKKNRVYTVSIDEKVEEILADLHLADSFFGIETGIDPRILEEDEASRAYLRGAFLRQVGPSRIRSLVAIN